MKAYAELNHGRWIVPCPSCNSALNTDPLSETVWWPVRPDTAQLGMVGVEDRVYSQDFVCFSCGTGPCPVVWPERGMRTEIHDTVAILPLEHRNWRNGETLEDILAQIAEHY